MIPSKRVGRYQLLDRIGAGGMAEIHLARAGGAAGFQKLVVIKRLLPALALERDQVTAFVDEGKIAASFSHANVVSTFDFGEADGAYFIAMEFVEGKNVRALLDAVARAGEPFPVPLAVYVVAEAARGLHHAHTRTDATGQPLSVVHRDVSPQNVVVSYEGDVKVLDFGIATAAGRATHTAPGVVKGKLRYMAPEQATGAHVDARADLFAIASMLHEMVHGRRSIPDLEGMELVAWIARAEFSPGIPEDGVPADVDALLRRALDPDPEKRPADCGELARELAKMLAHHWPDFAPADLAELMRRMFGDEMEIEREWIRTVLESSGESAVPVPAPASLAREPIPTPTDSKVLTLSGAVGRRPESAPPPAGAPGATARDSARPRVPPRVLALAGVVAIALAALAGGTFLHLRHAADATAIADARVALDAGDPGRAFDLAAARLDAHPGATDVDLVARAALRAKLDAFYASGYVHAGEASAWLEQAIAHHPRLAWLAERRGEASAAKRAGKIAEDAGAGAITKLWDEARAHPDDPEVPWAIARVVATRFTPYVSMGLYAEGLKRGHAPDAAFEQNLEAVFEEGPAYQDSRNALELGRKYFPAQQQAWAARWLDSTTNLAAAMTARSLVRDGGGSVPPDPVLDALARVIAGKGSAEDEETVVDAPMQERTLRLLDRLSRSAGGEASGRLYALRERIAALRRESGQAGDAKPR